MLFKGSSEIHEDLDSCQFHLIRLSLHKELGLFCSLDFNSRECIGHRCCWHMEDNFAINSYFLSISSPLRANHWLEVEEERNILWHIFRPNDGVVVSAPCKDGEGCNDQLQNIKEDGISEPDFVDSILGNCVLNPIQNEHNNVANEVLGDDEEEGNIHFTECENVPPGFSTDTSVVVIIEAERRNEDPNSSHKECMQEGRDECVSSNQDLCLDVNIRGLL